MTDRTNFPKAVLDDLAKLATNAAGLAQGAREELENLINSRLDRWLSERNFVTREEFDAVADMAKLAREENERLEAKLEALEKRLSDDSSK